METYADKIRALANQLDEDFKANLWPVARELLAVAIALLREVPDDDITTNTE
jgi:hypothetical protein